MKTTLFQLQAYEGYMFAYTARRFASKKFNLHWIPQILDDNQ
jgi:hypothetical protein